MQLEPNTADANRQWCGGDVNSNGDDNWHFIVSRSAGDQASLGAGLCHLVALARDAAEYGGYVHCRPQEIDQLYSARNRRQWNCLHGGVRWWIQQQQQWQRGHTCRQLRDHSHGDRGIDGTEPDLPDHGAIAFFIAAGDSSRHSAMRFGEDSIKQAGARIVPCPIFLLIRDDALPARLVLPSVTGALQHRKPWIFRECRIIRRAFTTVKHRSSR